MQLIGYSTIQLLVSVGMSLMTCFVMGKYSIYTIKTCSLELNRASWGVGGVDESILRVNSTWR